MMRYLGFGCSSFGGFVPVELGGVLPQPLQLIIIPLFLGEDMGDNIATVQKYPVGFALSFHSQGSYRFLIQFPLDVFEDGLHVARGFPTTYDEIIRDYQELADV